jgi:RND family efflux transporter MFP subunit
MRTSRDQANAVSPRLLVAALCLLAAGAPRAAAEELDCLIQPREIVTVSAPVEGVLEGVAVERGDVVEEGSVLAVLESSLERATVAIARARAQQDYGVKANQARAEYGARRFSRTDDLFKKSMVPAKDLDEAETAKMLAHYSLLEANEQKRLAELELARAEAALELRRIKSPISGVVMERLLHPGELAANESPIARLARLDPLRVEVFVPIALYGQVSVGQRARVVPEAPLDEALEATVTVVDKVADAASGTFGVRLEIQNPQNRIPGGLKCMVRIGDAPPRAGADAAPPGAEVSSVSQQP